MINKISLTNYKSFKSETILCNSLTLLAGANASGKSSVVQSLLLFKQADLSHEKATLHLNGDFVQLGSGAAVLHEWADDDITEINIESDFGSFGVVAEIDSGADQTDYFETDIPSSQIKILEEKIRYLGADRISPEETYPFSALKLEKRDLGTQGEFTISYLSKFKFAPLSIPALAHPSDSSFGPTGALISNVNAWLQDISPGVDINARRLQGTALAELRFGFKEGGNIEGLSSFNVGFGLTYTLPVVTLLLSAVPGDTLIIENPEAHVHPGGQLALGKLIALVATSGVQVIVETHSDHIFNGMRLFIKANPSQVGLFNFYFVDRVPGPGAGFHSQAIKAEVADDGKFVSAPNGFFDAWETALLELI